MDNELILRPRLAVDQTDSARAAAALIEAFLAGRSERTLRAYRQDLETFRTYLEQPSIDAAAQHLLSQSHGAANGIALSYRNHLVESGLAPATVNRRLAAVRSLVTLARTLGHVSWTLEVRGVKGRKYRDTRGPGVGGFEQLIDVCRGRKPKVRRDRAILWLLFGLALRRGEVVALDLCDVELGRNNAPSGVWILGKGRSEKELVSVPTRVSEMIEDWMEARGAEPGPLFLNMDRAKKGSGRLTGAGLYALVRAIAKKAGLKKVRPHGLRHAAITAALDAGEDLRRVRRFSRHARIDTVLIYDDNRDDVAGDIAAKITRQVRKAA